MCDPLKPLSGLPRGGKGNEEAHLTASCFHVGENSGGIERAYSRIKQKEARKWPEITD